METLESLSGILPVIIEICAPILVILIGWLVRKLVKKLHVEAQINTEVLIEKICERAINYVEKMDKNLRKFHSQKMESGDKLAKAIDIVSKELKNFGLVKVTSDVLVEKIESILLEKGE